METKMKIWIGIIVGIFILAGILVFNLSQPQDISVSYGEAISLIPQNVQSPAIVFNNITLFDSTSFDEENNICNGHRHAMNITIYPCVAQSVLGKDIQHNVDFKWEGASALNVSWIFVYDGQLESGSMGLMQNVSRQETHMVNTWVQNHVVDRIVAYSSLGIPDYRCQIGNQNNTQMYNVTRNLGGNMTAFTQIYCFTEAVPINATAFSISGNADLPTQVTVWREEWTDITEHIEYLGYGLLDDNRSYYQVQNVLSNPEQVYKTLWTFTPLNNATAGKWHILGYETERGLVQSIIDDLYIYIDPWWNNDWTYKKPIYINVTSGEGTQNYSIIVNVTYEAEMRTDFGDLRFLDSSETNELGYWFFNDQVFASGSAQVAIYIGDLENQTIWMYYNNPTATNQSRINGAFWMGDNFDGSSLNTSIWTQSGGILTFGNSIMNLTHDGSGNDYVWSEQYKAPIPSGIEANILSRYSQDSAGTYFINGIITTPLVPMCAMGNDAAATKLYRCINGGTADVVRTSDYTQWIQKKIILNSTSASFFENEAYKAVITASLPTTTAADYFFTNGAGNRIEVAWAYLRPRVNSEPTVTFGSAVQANGVGAAFNYPATAAIISTLTPELSCNLTAAGTSVLSNSTVYVYNNVPSIVYLNTSYISGSANTTNWTVSTLSDGSYSWYCDVWGDDGTSSTSGSNRTFLIDTTPPVVILNATTSQVVTNSFPVNIVVNWTVADSTTSASWIEYNGVNYTATNNDPSFNATIPLASYGNQTYKIWASDTVGAQTHINVSTFVYWYFYNLTENQDPIAEGNVGVFTLNVTMLPSITTASAVFVYNNVQYSPDSVISAGNSYYFTKSLVIPSGTGNVTGKLVNWYWTYNISSFVPNTNTTLQNQTVYSVDIDDCSVYGDVILNMTLREEDTTNIVNATAGSNIEIDLIISSREDESVQWSYSDTWTNDAEALVCIPSGLLSGGSSYRMDFVAEYSSTDRVVEFYYLDNGTLDNTPILNSLTNKTINFYDLALDQSTTFLFEFLDQDSIEVPNAIVHVFRQYIGQGEFLEVERGKQDDNGETHIHLVEEDVIYYFKVSVDGQVIYTSSTYNAKCLSTPCSITLEASDESPEFSSDWQLLGEGGAYAFSQDATSRTVYLNFTLPEVATMNLTVYKQDYTGTFTVVDSVQTLSTGSSLSLVVPQAAGNVTFYAVLYKDGEYITQHFIDFSQSASPFYSTTGTVMGSLMIIALILMGAAEGILLFLFTILAMILVSALAIMKFGYYALVGFICAIVILIWKLIKRGRRFEGI
jgi:hypothetical protein